MFKFFRKPRHKLLTEKRYSKYLPYAIGEILLVVIGILIALQINNWNENQIRAKNEQSYLLGLKEEFQISKLKLSKLISVNHLNYEGAKKIINYTTNKNDAPTEEEFSELLFNTFSSDIAFNPNNSLLNEMINSGNLKNLSNSELRIQLTNWISTLDDISRQENELGVQRSKVLDMMRTNENSLKTIFIQAGVFDELGLPKTGNDLSNLALLQSTAFENNILMFILTSYATENAHYNPLIQDLDVILDMINSEIE